MDMKIFEAEYRFMELIWSIAPVNSTELVKVCQEQLGWKKSTTYTTIRRLASRGILLSTNATVTYLVTKEDVRVEESKNHLKKLYDGSMKLLLTSFLQREELTVKELQELRSIIDEELKGR